MQDFAREKQINYDKFDLNKLGDAELKQHKRAMDVEYNKAFVGKNDPNF
jgi:hypothetical protein